MTPFATCRPAVLAALVVSAGVWSTACGGSSPSSAGSDGKVSNVGSSLAASVRTTCARFDARICCWGDALAQPTVVPLSAAPTDIAVLGDSACAVVAGEVWCWSFEAMATPSRLELGGTATVARITASGGHACALRQDSTVACWGDNPFGQLGNGHFQQTEAVPTNVHDLTDAVEIAAGEYHTCARRRSGSVACWGRGFGSTPCEVVSNNCSARPVDIALPKPPVQLSAGGLETCAQTAEGMVYCWRADETTTPPTVAAPIAGAESLHLGYGLSCAIPHNHRPICWGGETNHRDYTDFFFPDGIIDTASGWDHTCARTEDESVICIGQNQAHQIGDGTTSFADKPGPPIHCGS